MFGLKQWRIAGLVLYPALLFAGQWDPLDNTAYVCDQGSAMAYGKQNGTPYVWLMQGEPGDHGYLDRFNISTGHWEGPLARMPQTPLGTDWGGALAWVTDPYSYPETGWLYALKGNGTKEFWVYTNDWYRLEDIPAEVNAGGALCFGGYHWDSGQQYAWVYAFVGGGSTRFFRFRRQLVPTRAPAPSSWVELAPASLLGPIQGGAALAWCPMAGTGNPKGLVYAQNWSSGNAAIYGYNPVANGWFFAKALEYSIGGGGAMTTKPGSDSVWCLRGGSSKQWWAYDPRNNTVRYFTNDQEKTWWQWQRKGAALCAYGPYVYAEIGHTSNRVFKRFSLTPTGEQGGGGQGGSGGIPVVVTVLAGPAEHRFRIEEPNSGPLALRIRDAAGREIACVSGGPGVNELAWSHQGVAPGIYFYSVEAAAVRAAGKVVVAR